MKTKIIHKAIDLFLTLGFKSVTMDDISISLGISKKTIYQYFKNKTDLVETATFSVFDTVCEGVEHISENSENPIKELYEVKMFLMKILKDEKVSPQYQLKKFYPDIYAKLQEKQVAKMLDSVRSSLQKGVDLGYFRSELDLGFISRLYLNGMNGIRDEDLFPRTLFESNYVVENYLKYHLRAITTTKGWDCVNETLKEEL